MKKLTSTLLLALILSVACISCSRVNNENYRKIEVGMEYSNVIDILGKPTECDAVLNAKGCSWGTQSKSISIQFVADKVVFFTSTGI